MIDSFLVFFATIVSCIFFELVAIKATVLKLFNSYREQLKILNSKELSEDEKQQALLKNVSFQVKFLLLLILKLFLFISPFLLLYVMSSWLHFDASLLVTLEGLFISVVAVGFYILLKALYAKLFPNR